MNKKDDKRITKGKARIHGNRKTKMNKKNNLKSGDRGDWIRTYAEPTPNSKDTLAYWLREPQIINTIK
jgi:hypothetical protein